MAGFAESAFTDLNFFPEFIYNRLTGFIFVFVEVVIVVIVLFSPMTLSAECIVLKFKF